MQISIQWYQFILYNFPFWVTTLYAKDNFQTPFKCQQLLFKIITIILMISGILENLQVCRWSYS